MIMAAQQQVKRRKRKHKCPPHHWIINSSNVGRCRDCPAERDFGMLLQREGVFVAAGRRGAKASSVARRPSHSRGKKKEPANAKISAAAKKRWEDPDYRAKQGAAHAALPGRRHKKEVNNDC